MDLLPKTLDLVHVNICWLKNEWDQCSSSAFPGSLFLHWWFNLLTSLVPFQEMLKSSNVAVSSHNRQHVYAFTSFPLLPSLFWLIKNAIIQAFFLPVGLLLSFCISKTSLLAQLYNMPFEVVLNFPHILYYYYWVNWYIVHMLYQILPFG